MYYDEYSQMFFPTPQQFFRVKKLIYGAFLRGASHSIIKKYVYRYQSINIKLILYCYIKKLLHVLVYYYTRPITSYAMVYKLWSTVPPAPASYLSLVSRKKVFFYQKVSSLSHLSSLSRSLVVISHLVSRNNPPTTQQPT